MFVTNSLQVSRFFSVANRILQLYLNKNVVRNTRIRIRYGYKNEGTQLKVYIDTWIHVVAGYSMIVSDTYPISTLRIGIPKGSVWNKHMLSTPEWLPAFAFNWNNNMEYVVFHGSRWCDITINLNMWLVFQNLCYATCSDLPLTNHTLPLIYEGWCGLTCCGRPVNWMSVSCGLPKAHRSIICIFRKLCCKKERMISEVRSPADWFYYGSRAYFQVNSLNW
jgi:hypothetical protein